MQLLIRGVLTIFIAVTFAGCYESAFPLDATSQAPLDAKLFGNWRCVAGGGKGDAARLVISRARDGVYAASIVEDGKVTDNYEVHASVVVDVTVLNVRDMKPSAKPWVYGRYQMLRPDMFEFEVMSDKALKGVKATPVAVRKAIDRQRKTPALWEDGVTCNRIRDAK